MRSTWLKGKPVKVNGKCVGWNRHFVWCVADRTVVGCERKLREYAGGTRPLGLAETHRSGRHAVHSWILHPKTRQEEIHQSSGGATPEGREANGRIAGHSALEERGVAIRLQVVALVWGEESLSEAKRRACRPRQTLGAPQDTREVAHGPRTGRAREVAVVSGSRIVLFLYIDRSFLWESAHGFNRHCNDGNFNPERNDNHHWYNKLRIIATKIVCVSYILDLDLFGLFTREKNGKVRKVSGEWFFCDRRKSISEALKLS